MVLLCSTENKENLFNLALFGCNYDPKVWKKVF